MTAATIADIVTTFTITAVCISVVKWENVETYIAFIFKYVSNVTDLNVIFGWLYDDFDNTDTPMKLKKLSFIVFKVWQ